MTKIKNFRITLRPREVARILKSAERLQITPALEASIEHAANDAKRLLETAAIYTTLSRTTADRVTTLPLTDPAVSVSVIAVSIGPGIENERQAASTRQDSLQTALLGALQQEALQQALQFVMRLIQEQAKEEECTLSPIINVQEETLLKTLAPLLGISRIGIPFMPDSPALPPSARLAWSIWSPATHATRSGKATERSEKTLVSK